MTKNKPIYYACVLTIFTWLIVQVGEAAPPEGMVTIRTSECFQMGSESGNIDEKPVHGVCLDSFHLDQYEVTQEKFEKALGKNPSEFKGAQRPVERVTWDEANEYCIKVGKRLPSEAEWEYAARAKTTTKYYWGDDMDGSYAWYTNNSDYKTHNVGLKKPNAWRLYDMSGNVWEWVQDWHDQAGSYYMYSPTLNPRGPTAKKLNPEGTVPLRKIVRGGGWNYNADYVRSANRGSLSSTIRSRNTGFRCAKNLPRGEKSRL